ncbi:MAG: efflux RND transporter periplasmic adaptor subunit [Betaproteobacteria bacterium]
MSTHTLRLSCLLCLLLPLAVACGKKEAAPEPLRPVLTQVLGTVSDADSAIYSGEIRSRFETSLGFRVAGKISARLVNTGALVKAGEVLARLDPADLALSAASANAQLELADADLRRYRELKGKNFVSQSALDAKETAYKAAKAQADLAKNQSAYTELRADKDGVVQSISAEIGQVVAAGQAVMSVARTDTLEVAVAIPEARVSDVRLRQAAEISLWSDEQVRYPGSVREVSQTADPVTRTYAARVTIVNPDARVLLGMTANVKFQRAGADQSGKAKLSVPLTAIFQQQGQPALWLVAADQTISLRRVEVAAFGDSHAVLASGVSAGERVVIAGVHKLTAGEKIRAVDALPTNAP